MADLTETLRADGHEIERLDLGGGLGIPYTRSNLAPPLPSEYGRLVREEVGHLGCEIEIEPGRLIAGNAGVPAGLRRSTSSEGEGRDFLILDAAMNDLIRPAMYGAHHDIVPSSSREPGAETRPFDVVGPVCESGDTFAKARECRRWLPATVSRSAARGPTGRSWPANTTPARSSRRSWCRAIGLRGDPRAAQLDEMISRETIPDWLG